MVSATVQGVFGKEYLGNRINSARNKFFQRVLSCFDYAGFKNREIWIVADFVSVDQTHTLVKQI